MNIYQLQDYFITEIIDGHPEDFLVNLDSQELLDEFSNLLYVWSKNRHDAQKLQSAMSTEISAIVCRVTKDMKTDPVEFELDDVRREAEDRAYQAWKDKI